MVLVYGCKKEEVVLEEPRIPEQWERFVGDYKIYDTLGSYLYAMKINHLFSGRNKFGVEVDSLVLENFADTFDLKYEFRRTIDKSLFSLGIIDSVLDRNNKHWYLAGLVDDLNTPIRENRLANDTLIMFFKQTNIKFYINEAQPYFYCECKHVAVKQ